jgi:hypothetical protein
MCPVKRRALLKKISAEAKRQRQAGNGVVAEVKTYDAEVSRDGKFWFIRIPELDRSTQAVRYRDIRAVAGELVEIMTGLAAGQFTLRVEVHLPDGVQHHLASS